MQVSVPRVVGGVVLGLLFTIFVTRAMNSKGLVTSVANPFAVDTATKKTANGKERIFIENVDVWRFDQAIDSQAQLLVGNVVLRHNNAYMYCDSAKLFQEQNRFEGYNNVRIVQGDSLEITCNYIDYDGTTMVSRLREFVVMKHGDNTLYTDSLDYDRVSGLGYYFDSGSITDTLNVLSSIYGEYDTKTKKAVFQDEVVLDNPNFKLYTDILHYDTETKLADITSPSRIVGDSGVILTSRGTYDTANDLAYLMNGPVIESGTRWMTGDSIFYDRGAQRAEIYGHINMKDTADQVALRGNYAEYHEETSYGYATDSAYMAEYSGEDTLYVHAHILEMIKVDSVSNLIKGRGNARLYREDMQAVSDSILYYSADSVMHWVGHPFVWSGKSQVTGDSLSIYIKNGAVDYAHIRENAYLSNKVDDKEHYNQMRGREVLAYFSDNKLDSVWTRGNAEVIYYSLNQDSVPTEHIKSQSSAILMQFEKEEISLIKLLDRTVGTMTPIILLDHSQLFYPGFVWFPEGRPTSFLDIFRTTPKPSGNTSQPANGQQPQPEASPAELAPKATVAEAAAEAPPEEAPPLEVKAKP
ncbi:LPS-assembly protein LptD [Porphyromonas levii]|uniref:OstA-like protein n=1 Tax=Porphyromonas levii TaxID=28114 RepID=UPI00201313DE|nr:OstA-like protein [Porphyromonas levii]MBR8785371.1 LPS-assembly protein LptD [Porphyromonas levii]